jgi:hypothetical protein
MLLDTREAPVLVEAVEEDQVEYRHVACTPCNGGVETPIMIALCGSWTENGDTPASECVKCEECYRIAAECEELYRCPKGHRWSVFNRT